MKKEKIECSICNRLTPPQYQEKHHLIPKSQKGKETIIVCCNCGDILHKLFSNKEMEKIYNNLDAILYNDDVQKWIKWIKKKPNSFSVCMKNKRRKR